MATMTAHAIHHINIRAGRALLAEMKDFYEGVLGLRAGWRPPFKSTGYWLYLADTAVLHLVEDDRIQAAEGPRGPIVDHVAFTCTGLRAFEDVLTARRTPFRRTEVPETRLVQLNFFDPAGNGVELLFADKDT